MLLRVLSLGSVSSKNMLFCLRKTILQLNQSDGHIMDSQAGKGLFTALLEQILLMEGQSLTLTTKLASMQESKSQVSTLRPCLVNLSFKLAHARELKSEIIFGWQDIFLEGLQRTSKSQYLMTLNCSNISLDQVVTSTSQQKK